MARIRTIKPGFFRHEGLFELERETGLPIRVSFAALWTVADREGRFEWRPRQLKLDCLPYDTLDFADVLNALQGAGFIRCYEANGQIYGYIPSWNRHQVVNQREAKSIIPPPTETHVHADAFTADSSHIPNGVNVPASLRETVFARDNHACVRCKAKTDLTVDHIFPRSLGGTHAITNLRTLCRSCNSARPVQGEALISDLAKDGFTLNDMQRICMHVQYRGEGEGEGKGNTHTQRARDADPAGPDDQQDPFADGVSARLPLDWKPNPDHLALYAKHAGLPLANITPEAVNEFTAYWHARGDPRTSSQWCQALVANVKNNRGKPNGNPDKAEQRRPVALSAPERVAAAIAARDGATGRTIEHPPT